MRSRHRARLNNIGLGALGIATFLVAWEIIGQFRLAGLSWPPLTAVITYLSDTSRWPLFGRALSASIASLGWGYAIGLLAGLATAICAHLLPRLKAGLDRTSAFVNAIPSIALAPVFIVFVGMNSTPTALAALTTFFVIYVSTTSGLAATAPQWKDLMRVLGASAITCLWRVEIPAALPAITNGMRLAAPASLIGVLVGEWFGSPRGIGVLIINAMQNFQIPLLWSAVLLTVTVSLSLFGVLGLLQSATANRFR